MNLISLPFLIFLISVFILYFIIPQKYQWIVLLVASYIFYLFSGLGLVVFLLFATLITYLAGIFLEKSNTDLKNFVDKQGKSLPKEQLKYYKTANTKKKNNILVFSLLLVLGVLGFLKYFNFFAANINSFLNIFPVEIEIPTIKFLLPLGISFYTFQSIGYIIDINRGKISADKNFLKFALFLSFFPQIVQGPISRYDQLAHQLYDSHSFDYNRVKFGLQLMLWGLFKKMVIADRLAIAVDTIFTSPSEFKGLSIYIGAVFLSFQIYCDFSGGIDIARGIAQSLGITLAENFRRPFFSTSIEEYWRRWHITLGSWMRDYVFYPLSLSKTFTKLGRTSRKLIGKRLGKIFPVLLASIITFLAVGIWHGPYWKYIAFGLYYSLLISLGLLITPSFNKLLIKLNIKTDCFSWRLTKIILIFTVTTIGRYFTHADGLRHALRMLQQTFSVFNPWVLFDGTFLKLGLIRQEYFILFISILFLIVVEYFQEKGVCIRTKLAEQNLIFRWSFYFLGIFSIIIFGIYGATYDSTDFIYRGF